MVSNNPQWVLRHFRSASQEVNAHELLRKQHRSSGKKKFFKSSIRNVIQLRRTTNLTSQAQKHEAQEASLALVKNETCLPLLLLSIMKRLLKGDIKKSLCHVGLVNR